MKVLVISGAFPPMRAPESAHALHLCQKLAERGVEVHLLTSRANTGPTDCGFHVHPIMRGWTWRDAWTLRSFTRRLQPDAILLIYIGFIYDLHPMITFAPIICKMAAPRARFVTQFENTSGSLWLGEIPDRSIGKLLRPAMRCVGFDRAFGMLLSASDHVIGLCEYHRSRLIRWHGGEEDRVTVIPAPPIMRITELATSECRKRGRRELGLDAADFVLVYFGYVYPGKGVETLLGALRIASTTVPRMRLVIVGSCVTRTGHDGQAYMGALNALATKLGIGNRVIWSGYCTDETAAIYLHAADLCILPLDEGVRLNNSSFAVAATLGLPILATKAQEPDAQFVDGVNVAMCPPGDAEAMGRLVVQLAGNSALRQRLSQGAQRLADEWLSWDQATARTLQVLTQSEKAVADQDDAANLRHPVYA